MQAAHPVHFSERTTFCKVSLKPSLEFLAELIFGGAERQGVYIEDGDVRGEVYKKLLKIKREDESFSELFGRLAEGVSLLRL